MHREQAVADGKFEPTRLYLSSSNDASAGEPELWLNLSTKLMFRGALSALGQALTKR